MTDGARASATVWLVSLGLSLAQVSCSRATLDAVTGPTTTDAANDGLPSAGCASSALAAGDTTRTVQVGTVSRSYVLHLPAAYDGKKAAPLVLDFHGIGGTGTTELGSSPYPSLLDPAGVVMAFPDGMKGPAGSAWNVGPCCVAGVDDVAFARAVVADVGQAACIDTSRVYAVGVLTGGGMATLSPARPPTSSRRPRPPRSTCWPRTWAPASRRGRSASSLSGGPPTRASPMLAATRRWGWGCRSPSWARWAPFKRGPRSITAPARPLPRTPKGARITPAVRTAWR